MKKTVGIITTFRQPNFGSVLQGYSLYKIINDLGYDAVLIDYIYPNSFHNSHGISSFTHKEKIKRKIGRLLGLRGKSRMSLLNEFIKHNIKVSKEYDYWSIKQDPPVYDLYVTGSDQVWNPNTMKGDMTYFLDFTESHYKIAYAPSFSCDNIPSEYIDKYIYHLNKYSALSSREKNGTDLIYKIIGAESPIVLDPTLLIKKEDWSILSEKCNRKLKLPQKYILFYMLGYTYSPKNKMYEILELVQNKTGYTIIPLTNIDNVFKGKIFELPKNISIGIYEFLKLIKDASIVVTSSFHGTAFAANFGVPLISLENGQSHSDDRISSLLKLIGLQNNLLLTTDEICEDNLNWDYNIDKIQGKLDELREKSIEYLRYSLINC